MLEIDASKRPGAADLHHRFLAWGGDESLYRPVTPDPTIPKLTLEQEQHSINVAGLSMSRMPETGEVEGICVFGNA